MKLFAVVLALLTALPASGRAAPEPATPTAEASASTWPVAAPLTVTAPRIKDQAALETARAAGAGAAVAGTGLMVYVVFAGATGPFGWAAALVFLGGMTSYLSHRRLHGKEDFSWSAPLANASSDPGASPPMTASRP